MIRQIFRKRRENPAAQAIKCMKIGSNRIATAIRPYAREILGVGDKMPQDKFEKRTRFLSKKAIKMLAAPENGKSNAVIAGNNERAEKAMFSVRMASARKDKGFFTKLFDDLNKKRLEEIKQARQRVEQVRAKRTEAKAKAFEEARAKAKADAAKEKGIQSKLREFEAQVRAEFAERHKNPQKPEETVKPSGRHIKDGIAKKVAVLPKAEREEIQAYQQRKSAQRKQRREQVQLRQNAQIDRRAKRAEKPKISAKPTEAPKDAKQNGTKPFQTLPAAESIILEPTLENAAKIDAQEDTNPFGQIRAMHAYLRKNGSTMKPPPKPKAKSRFKLPKQPKLKSAKPAGGRARLRELEAEMRGE